MSLNCQIVLILFQVFKIILNLSLKNMKHSQQFLLFMFISIRINNKFLFKIKDGCKLELQTQKYFEALFDSTKKLVNKTKKHQVTK